MGREEGGGRREEQGGVEVHAPMHHLVGYVSIGHVQVKPPGASYGLMPLTQAREQDSATC